MKHFIYVIAFVVLGVLLQFLIHAGLEIWYIRLLVGDFPRYGLGLSWKAWLMIHDVGSIILFVLGVAFGYWQGNYWWRRVYPVTR